MKNFRDRIRNWVYFTPSITVLILTLVIYGCKKLDRVKNEGTAGKTRVYLNVISDSFEDLTSYRKMEKDLEQKADFKIDEDYYGSAVLKPIFSYEEDDAPEREFKIVNNFIEPIKYKVIVFDKLDNFVEEKEFIWGADSKAEYLMLDAGETYSFVVYAVNKAFSLPDLIFSSPTSKTLNSAQVKVKDSNGVKDFMYFKKYGVRLTENSVYLNIELKHLLSELTVIVDASRTKEKISEFNANFNSHRSIANVNLIDGAIIPSENTSKSKVTFAKLDQTIITSNPIFVNNQLDKGPFTIDKIRLGSLTRTHIVPFIKNPEILPGFKYELKLTVYPKDKYVVVSNEQGVMIKGRIWMNENLGHAVSRNYNLARLGRYYQWGGLHSVAEGIFTSVNANWLANNNPSNTVWNAGTEEKPIKAPNDPCPEGFRIPTVKEYKELFASTIERNMGTFQYADDINHFDSYRILTSKISDPIKLYFPLQGSIGYKDAQVFNKDNALKKVKYRGVQAEYWTSTTTANNQHETILYTAHMAAGINEIKSLSAFYVDGRLVSPKIIAHPIRCIDNMR